jgi:parallel beta-helix repeat protein
MGGSTGSQVHDNTVYNNTWMGIDVSNSVNAAIKNNTVYGNSPNIYSGNAIGAVITVIESTANRREPRSSK